jgi:hypothetical protein
VVLDKKRCGREEGENMEERLPLTNNYISTKVGSTNKNGERNGQNGMGEKGGTSWLEEEDE